MSGGNRFQGNSNPNRQGQYVGNNPQGYGGNQMDDDMYYGSRGNTRGGNLNNQAYYGNSGNVDNRRGGYNKGPGMQTNPQAAGHYGHGQYGNNAPMPQQYGGQGGQNMRGGMRGQQSSSRGGGNPMMGATHHGYYNQDMNQPADNSMNYPPTQGPLNQRGGYGGMGGQRGGMQGGNQGGQGSQRMYNQMPPSNIQNPHQGGMPPMHQNPNPQRNMGQASNPNMGYNDYNMPPKGRANQDQGYGGPVAAPVSHGIAPAPVQSQNRNMMPVPPQQRGMPQQNMGAPVQPILPQNQINQQQDAPLPFQSEIIMKRYNTLDRGTYFIDQANKSINFIVDGESDLLGWYDDYLINGYLLYGIVIKVTTLTSRIYLFIEKEHEIYQNFIRCDGDKLKWKNLPKPDELHIATINSVEKVEIYDNSEDGFEGFVCYTVNEDSQLTFSTDSKSIQDWVTLQRTFLLFEPTSIKKIFLDVLHNWLHQPESTKFQGKSVAAIINPKIPGNAVVYSNSPKYIQSLDGEYYVGIIALQYGRYTLLSQSKENMENFSRLVEKILDIAEELDGYVMITNLKRQYDSSQQQKTILILPFDPTLKIVRYEGTMNFDKTKDKLSKVITM
jgi:hypothetical protein